MIVDSHCHLDFPDFSDDIDAVITRAAAADVRFMLTISTRVKHFDRICRLTETYPAVYGSVGTHPHNAHEELDIVADDLVRLSKHEKCVAIGEAGLDYFYDKSPREVQAEGLRHHIEAARRTGLPLIIHARNADEDMIRILEDEAAKGFFPALLHCFSSGRGLMEAGVALGFFVSFSGILTFNRSADLQEIAKDVPLDRLLIETDAPFLAPQPWRGKRNEPAYVAHTLKVLAALKGMTADEMASVTTDNFFRLFSKVPRPTASNA